MLFDRFRMKGIAVFATATLALAMTATPTLGAAGTHQTALAKLFSGTAQVELREHFAGEAVLAGLVGTNAANLQDSITGETWEHTTMYPGFTTQATTDGCTAAGGPVHRDRRGRGRARGRVHACSAGPHRLGGKSSEAANG